MATTGILYSISGKEFTMPNVLTDIEQEVTVLSTGYIIIPNGKVIQITENDIHNTVCCEYLSKYLECNCFSKENNKGIKMLIDNGHIIYFGVRLLSTAYWQGTVSKFLFTPEFDKITDEQYKVMQLLVESNISSISKIKMVDLYIGNYNTPQSELQLYEECMAEYNNSKNGTAKH